MRKKLRSRRGETLVEALCSVLVAALATAMLAGMVSSASHLNAKARENDEKLYVSVTSAETFLDEAQGEGVVNITVGTKEASVNVRIYGDVVSSYERSGG